MSTTPLSHNRLPLQHQAHRCYTAKIPAGVPLEALFEPGYWLYFARILKVGDRIEVIADDGAFDGDVRVTSVTEFGAKVRQIYMTYPLADDTTVNEITLAKAEISWGGAHKWRIMLPGGKVVTHGHTSKEAAQEELDRLRSAA